MKIHTALLVSLLLAIAAPLSAADAPSTAPAAPAYPLTTCLVSDEPLGSMGDAYIYTHREPGKPDRQVQLCCKGCVKKFTKDPAKYLGKLDAAAAKSAAAKSADNSAADAHAH